MNQKIHIDIGGEKIRLDLTSIHHRLFRLVEKDLRVYRISATKECYSAKIIPYDKRRRFHWKRSKLERFTNLFSRVYSRFPREKDVHKATETSLEILKHLDPEDESVRHITSCVNHPPSLLCAGTGSDLYFIDRKSNRAFYVTGHKGRMPVLGELFQRLGIRKADMLLGVISGLMFQLSYILMRGRGLLLHGAAVRKNNMSILFLGSSDAGKSTISRLCEPDILYSDDGVIIRKEDNGFFVFPSPFSQANNEYKKRLADKGEIEKLFLIKKGLSNRIIPIKKCDMMNMILSQLLHFYKYLDNETSGIGFYAVKDLLDTIPAYKLEFAKGTKIWDDIS